MYDRTDILPFMQYVPITVNYNCPCSDCPLFAGRTRFRKWREKRREVDPREVDVIRTDLIRVKKTARSWRSNKNF